MNIQNQNELTERELKIKNNSPQNHKKLPIQVQRILCFQKKGRPLLVQNEVRADIFL